MRASRLPFALSAAMALMAAPAPALACADHAPGGGGGTHHGKPAKPAKPAKPGAKPAAKPMTDDCCKPEAGAKPAAPAAKKDDCCKPGAAAARPACCAPKADGSLADCCKLTASGQPQACCTAAAGAAPVAAKKNDCCDSHGGPQAAKPQAGQKEACCDAPKADGSCCSPDKPHGWAPGQRVERVERIERRWIGRPGEDGPRWGRGPWGQHRMMMWNADRLRGPEVRYMPAMAAGGNQHLVVARNAQFQVKPWLSLGHQMNWALQLGNGPNAGPWVTPYGGFLPRLGGQVGPLRADVGALLGLGAMLRTGQVATTTGVANDVLQARLMWVVEPRVELGWRGEHMGVGLVGSYNYNPNFADFGGPSVGLKLTWKRPSR